MAIAINPSDPGAVPGASTKTRAGLAFRRGRNRIDEGVKVALSPGMVPPLSGRTYSCQRQLCSGRRGCVMQLRQPIQSPAGAPCISTDSSRSKSSRSPLPKARSGGRLRATQVVTGQITRASHRAFRSALAGRRSRHTPRSRGLRQGGSDAQPVCGLTHDLHGDRAEVAVAIAAEAPFGNRDPVRSLDGRRRRRPGGALWLRQSPVSAGRVPGGARSAATDSSVIRTP